MEQRAGAQIGRKAFIQSAAILLVLMVAAGIMTRIVQAGSYQRANESGREVIVPGSFVQVARPFYPIWRWFTAPVEVLWGSDGATIMVILLFLLMIGSSFAVLDKSGLLNVVVARMVKTFGRRKYILLPVISFFFMLIGAFLGIFEEVVPLVPLMVALSYSLGWDSLVGLGMSILATNMGFSAAVMNPFSIGVAHKIAGLPLFSGAWLRIIIFLVVYAVFIAFLTAYARRVERNPASSTVFQEDQVERARHHIASANAPTLDAAPNENMSLGKATAWFLAFLALILLVLISGPLLPAISALSLPLVGVLFFLAGVGAGFLAGLRGKSLLRALGEGIIGIAPGIPLILMAASVKHIVTQGGIMDTLLYDASSLFVGTSPLFAALLIYVLALLVEFFIGSASAKAFLIMPILLPLADLVGVTRQVAVTAYCFGDGFSNLVYPTNPVLLIALGLTVVNYPRWLRWSLKLWLWVVLVTVAFLWIAVAIRFGPF